MFFNLNDPNTITASISLITEIILLAIFVFANKKSHNFEKSGYDQYVYAVVLINIVVSITWMLPQGANTSSKITFGQTGFEKVIFIAFGGFIGSFAILFAVILCIQLYSRRSLKNQANEFFIRRLKIISRFTFIFWFITFLIGALLYFLTYF